MGGLQLGEADLPTPEVRTWSSSNLGSWRPVLLTPPGPVLGPG